MTAAPKLTVISLGAPKQEPIDIYAPIRAKIGSIDWRQVHINGDRAPAVSLPDRIRRIVRR